MIRLKTMKSFFDDLLSLCCVSVIIKTVKGNEIPKTERNRQMTNLEAFKKCLDAIADTELEDEELDLVYATIWNALFTKVPADEIDEETGEVYSIEANGYVDAILDATLSYCPYTKHPLSMELVESMDMQSR